MSLNVNSVQIAGNLVRDVDLRDAGQSKVANMTIAVNDRYKAKDGTFKEKTAFIAVTAWGKTAEHCAQFLRKGSGVFVEGKLDQEAYEDKDGKKVTKTKVTAQQVHFLGDGKPKQYERAEPLPAIKEDKPISKQDEGDW